MRDIYIKEILEDDVIAFEKLLKAGKDCQKNVKWKSSVQMFGVNTLRWISSLEKDLAKGAYKTKGFNEFWIKERGKIRHIQSVHISERTVQKSLCQNALKPAILPRLVYDNSASQNGKGTEFALNRLKCHLSRHYRKYGRSGGVLTIDYHNYFGSIKHEYILNILKGCIHDQYTYKLCEDFINAFEGDTGIGLGSEISQICAIVLPNEIDHYIKEQLKIKGYGRYMDDSYLIHQDVEYLKHCLDEIRERCLKLGITLNEKKTKITRFETESFEFLKKRIFISVTGKIVMRLTRENIRKRRQKLKKHKKLLDAGKISFESIAQSYQSWRGYAQKYNTYNTIKNMDKLFRELFRKEIE